MARPRLQTVLDAVSEGAYDDSLIELHEALQERLDLKKEEIKKMFKAVYGFDPMEESRVAPTVTTWTPPAVEIASAGHSALDAAEVDGGQLELDLESHSPQIGDL